MRRWWSADELVERWSLTPEDLSLLVGRIDAGKLGLAAQLAYWRRYGTFPDEETDLAPAVIAHLAAQVGVGAGALDSYDWSGRTGRRHRQAILDHLAITNFDDKAEAALRRWLAEEVLQREPNAATLEDEIGAWFARRRIVRPGAYRLDRIVHSACAVHDDDVLRTVADRLDPEVHQRLDGLLADDGTGAAFTRLAADPGRVGLESLLAEIDKLNVVRALALPADLLRGVHADLVKRFRRRAAVETAWELRRHPERTRLPLLAFYCLPREAEIVDGLVELLIQVTHRITVKAEKRVVEELLADAVQVRGKIGILFNVARAALDKPDGVVREVIFPVAGEQTFEKLVKEVAAGAGQRHARIHTVVRASYGSYYRRMLPKLLAAIEFRSNNATHRPLLDAIEVIRAAVDGGRQYYELDEIAVEDVIRPKWRDIVIEDAPDGTRRVNRINYEICVLQSLRERLRCREVWVVGAERWRNPDDDLPADFAERRDACYERLGLPRAADAFIAKLKAEMTDGLDALDRDLPRNPKVKLKPHRRHPIVVTPLEPQPEPPNLKALKVELGRRWPMTGLLDILKEADLRIGFTDAFATAATREATDRGEIRRRLLFSLYGLGTNAGLKRLADGRDGFSYKELLQAYATRPAAWSMRRSPRGCRRSGARARPLAQRIRSTSARSGAGHCCASGDLDGFIGFTKTFRTPTIYEAIKNAKPDGEVVRYNQRRSVRRHFHKLDRFPRGLIPLGDSVCRFNPVFGQGMTVAAMEAVVLGKQLARQSDRADPIDGLATDYLIEIQDCLEAPWATAITDFVHPQTRGDRPADFDKRLQYGMALTRLAAEDAGVHKALFEVTHLLRPHSALREPELASRVTALMAAA